MSVDCWRRDRRSERLMRSDLLEKLAAEPDRWWAAGELATASGGASGVGMALRGLFTRGWAERRQEGTEGG